MFTTCFMFYESQSDGQPCRMIELSRENRYLREKLDFVGGYDNGYCDYRCTTRPERLSAAVTEYLERVEEICASGNTFDLSRTVGLSYWNSESAVTFRRELRDTLSRIDELCGTGRYARVDVRISELEPLAFSDSPIDWECEDIADAENVEAKHNSNT